MASSPRLEISSYDHASLVSERGRHYREEDPLPEASSVIARVWLCRKTRDPARPHRVLPDACLEIVADVAHSRALVLVGPTSRAYEVPLADGACLAGVRLRLGVARRLFGRPVDGFRDRFESVPLDADLWPSGDAAACLRALQRWTVERCPEPPPLPDAVLRAIGESSSAPATDRRLRRLFAETIGLGPKRFSRVQRLWRVLAAKRADPSIRWGVLAAEYGFSDHAHMDREFLALTGGTPSDWWTEFGHDDQPVSDEFLTSDLF